MDEVFPNKKNIYFKGMFISTDAINAKVFINHKWQLGFKANTVCVCNM